MLIEPGYNADGSIGGWLCYRQDEYLGSFCKAGPRRWVVNDAECATLGAFKTRKAAIDFILRRSVSAAYNAHLAAFRATNLSPREKADLIAATRIALQEAGHELRRSQH